ncbi:MAG: SH3 domain-containing protein, partial [Erysipelotrichaceae bacterium]
MHKRRKKLRYKNILILISMLLITLIGTVFFLYLFDVFKNNDDNGETIVEPLSEPPVITYDYLKQGGLFELPITGATGFSAISQELLDSPSVDANIITILSSGQGFVIIEEADGWWYIEFNGFKGWVLNQNCLINLPDILPSIIYDNTNAYLSKLKSSGI